MKKVVITGMGVVSPLDCGKGTEVFWERLCNGINAIKPINGFSTKGHKCNVGGEIFEYESFLENQANESAKCTKLFSLACQYALKDANIGESIQSSGIIVGTILGDMKSGEQYLDEKLFMSKKSGKDLFKKYCLSTIADSIRKQLSLRGPAITVNTACCSGADAIRCAASYIRNNKTPIMLAGGVDILSEFVFRGFSALNALTTDGKVRPFDKTRTGLALSEGAGIVVLEDKEHADKRGAKAYCVLESSGSSADAYNIVKPHEEGAGLSRAINNALSNRDINVGSVDYICAHGTGTQHNDNMETRAIKNVFGKRAGTIKISSMKSMIGHMLGAASAVEAISCVKALECGIIPPTINYETPDPECDLDYVANRAIKKNINVCMSLSAGFGGQNTALIFKKI